MTLSEAHECHVFIGVFIRWSFDLTAIPLPGDIERDSPSGIINPPAYTLTHTHTHISVSVTHTHLHT